MRANGTGAIRAMSMGAASEVTRSQWDGRRLGCGRSIAMKNWRANPAVPFYVVALMCGVSVPALSEPPSILNHSTNAVAEQPGATGDRSRDDARSHDAMASMYIPIYFEPAILDFGVVEPNESHSAAVVLCNRTDAPIEIVRINASCDCSIASVDDKIILSESTATITITLRAPAEHGGAVRRTVDVELSNGIVRPPLMVVARTRPLLTATIDNSTITERGELRILMTLDSSDDSAFQIVSAGPAPLVTLESTSGRTAANGIALVLTPDDEGRCPRKVWLTTDHALQKRIDCSVPDLIAKMAEPGSAKGVFQREILAVFPRRLKTGLLHAGEESRLMIFISGWPVSETPIVVNHNPEFDVAIAEIQPFAGGLQIALMVRPQGEPGSLRGDFRLVSESAVSTVQVRGRIAPASQR